MSFTKEAASQQKLCILSKDSGGGFFLQDQEDGREEPNKASSIPASSSVDNACHSRVHCIECFDSFDKSYLRTHFNFDVCDDCRDTEKDGKHSLITRTEAKTEYLLNDVDLDKREPPLPFITKRNPHGYARSDMRLYLRPQVRDRAVLVHGNEDAILEEKEKRTLKRKQTKQKKFNKKINQLRMDVRSSLFTKDFDKTHEHDFEDEVCVDEDEDLYEKKCKTCNQVMRFEKL